MPAIMQTREAKRFPPFASTKCKQHRRLSHSSSSFFLIWILSFGTGHGQFCTRLASNNWASFVAAVEQSNGFAVLCPFEISGDGCLSALSNPEGYVVSGQTGQIIVCNPFFGFNSLSSCIIDCPGRHFTVNSNSSLTLDSFNLSGATMSSIQVNANAQLSVINSRFAR